MKFLKHSLTNIKKHRYLFLGVRVLPLCFLGVSLLYLAQIRLIPKWIEQNQEKTLLSLSLIVSARTEQGAPVAGAQIFANDHLVGATGSYGIFEGITPVALDKGNFVVKITKGEGRKAIIKEQRVFYTPAEADAAGQVKVSFLTPENKVLQ